MPGEAALKKATAAFRARSLRVYAEEFHHQPTHSQTKQQREMPPPSGRQASPSAYTRAFHTNRVLYDLFSMCVKSEAALSIRIALRQRAGIAADL